MSNIKQGIQYGPPSWSGGSIESTKYQAERELEVPRQVAEVEHAIELCEAHVKTLKERLGTVLGRHSAPDREEVPRPDPPLCDLAERLRGHARRAYDVASAMEEMLSLLEV